MSESALEKQAPLSVRVTPWGKPALWANLMLKACGVIYGDIGTSPLYVMFTIFTSPPPPQAVIGAVSLVLWSLIIVVTLKYATFVLLADNHGEGGTFALGALLTARNSRLPPAAKTIVALLSILGASLVIADGAFTPPVSVLGAMEGLSVAIPSLSNVWIVRITVIILIILFLFQFLGTARIGITFGPIIILWFSSLAAIGVWRITFAPKILRALNPYEALHYLAVYGASGVWQLGGVFLAVTGVEALYADLGHFGRWAVRGGWSLFALPALSLNYIGQGALLIHDPSTISNPFYRAAPHWAYWPMLVLATAATIIASQAIISGSFSLISQAISMGFCPPLRVIPTSKTIAGQIYVPTINFLLMAVSIGITFYFGTAANISNAYGLQISLISVITSLLYISLMRYVWNLNVFLVVPFLVFVAVDLLFLVANAQKVPNGGWVAILLAGILFVFCFCWWFGESRLVQWRQQYARVLPLSDLPRRVREATTNTTERAVAVKSRSRMGNPAADASSRSSSGEKPKPVATTATNIEPVTAARYSFDFDLGTIGSVQAGLVPASVVFISDSLTHTPWHFEAWLQHVHAMPDILIFLVTDRAHTASVSDAHRFRVTHLGERMLLVVIRYGFAERELKVHQLLISPVALAAGVPELKPVDSITYVRPSEWIKVRTVGWRTWITRWPLYIYSFQKDVFHSLTNNVSLPPAHTLSVGMSVEL